MLTATLLVVVVLTPAFADSARYRLELDLTWSANTHPHEWPPEGGHMSDLVGATHTARYVMFADGRTASSGLKLVAENGRPSILKAELAEARRRERVGTTFRAGGLAQMPGAIAVEFETDEQYPLVSFVTMIAPSPDWFTGVASVSLRANGRWRERITLALWAWDAGTDSGASYLSDNSETQPAQSIRLVATPHFLSASGLKGMGEVVLVKVD